MFSKFIPIALLSLLVFGNLLPAPSATANPDQSTGWEAIGQAGGPMQGIAVQGNYAYVGVGPRLIVVDISNPANPHPVGATAPFDYFVQGVTVSGTTAFVAAGSAGLRIVNIAAPSHPIEVGAWDSPGFAENVAVSGSTAYLADGPYGLRVVDVTIQTAPTEIAHAFDMNYAVDVAVSGRYAYIAAAGAGLLVAEISNPLYPIEAGVYDTPGYARALAASGSQVFLADERSGLLILNASDPLHPTRIGSVQTEGWAFDVAISGSLAYVAAAFGGLRVVNINNPAAPVEVGSNSWKQSNAAGLFAAGGYIFIADRKDGLRVVEAATPPGQVGYWNVFSFAHSVQADNNYAYVAAGFNGVRIFNLSDLAHPVEVGAFLADGLFYTLKLDGNRLYAGTMINSPAGGVYVLDISDRAHPQQIGYYQDISECWGIEVAGNIVYVADAGDLKVFDFSHPPNLNLIGSYPLTPRGLTVRNGLAFISQEYDGLNIYNVSNPAAISLVGSYKGANTFTHGPVGLSGNYAYITEQRGLRILNVTNPAAPTEVSFTSTHDEANWLVLNDSGSRVYVSEGSYGFSVYDVSNPAAPQLLNQTSVLGSVQVLTLTGGRLFTASGEGGLQIFTETALGAQTQPSPAPQTAQQVQTVPIPMPGHQAQTANLSPDIPALPLEPDRPAGTCIVTSAANSGSGTLRSCLENQAGGDVILFSPTVFPPSAPVTIHVGPERLPWLTRGGISIDASNAGVILDGSSVSGSWDPGIGISSDNNSVRGLQIVNFPMGINILGHNNLIGGSRLVGSAPTGQGNVVSGNNGDGVAIYLGAHGNIVLGNLVGLNAAGTQANPNAWAGVSINQSPNNTIGSLNPSEDNIISANDQMGIILYGYASLGNKIIGNKVGTDITGNLDLGNQGVGLYVESGSANTLVHGNLISGNGVAELYVWDFGTDFNVLTGNHIGTNLAGTAPLPNLTSTGIATGSAAYTRIGGTAPGDGNVVANPSGVWVDAPFGANTRITGNHIGLNAAGTAGLDSAGGLRLNSASRTLVGGATLAEANYITTDGNFSLDVRSPDNVIAGNFMGLAADGITPLATAGFQVASMRDGNIIQGNRMANSTSASIWADGAQANTIRRNSIWANPFKGIFLENGANNNLIAPVLSLSAAGGSGTTCPGCTVELFLDEGNQGRFYLNSVAANIAGAFSFPAYCPLSATYLTATVTDLQGNTSEFSEYQAIPWNCTSARPTPTLSSLDPTSQPALASTFLLTLTGAGFYANSVVRWDGITLPTSVISSTLAQAAVPSYLFQEGGNFSATVFTPAPGGGESNALMVSIAPPKMVYLPIVLRK
jgi:hypothetical protein